MQSVYTDGTVDFGALVASHVSGIKNDGRAWFSPFAGPGGQVAMAHSYAAPAGRVGTLCESPNPLLDTFCMLLYIPLVPLLWLEEDELIQMRFFTLTLFTGPAVWLPVRTKKYKKKGPLLKKFPSSEAAFVVFFWLKLFCNHLFPLM